VNATRLLPLAVFAAGLVTVLGAAACGGGSDKKDDATVVPSASASAAATGTATPSATATATATITPTPSPTPYNGTIKSFALPKDGIDAPVEQLGLLPDNELDTPHNGNTDVGWYYMYDKPGRTNPDNLAGWQQLGGQTTLPAKGNAVFSAHVYWNFKPAPFKNLYYNPVVQIGDPVNVTMEDGRVYHYQVISKTQYNRDTIPMGDIIWPKNKPADEEWLTMITCGGALDSTGVEYVDRVVVVAKRVD
jgi:hypothetical protein